LAQDEEAPSLEGILKSFQELAKPSKPPADFKEEASRFEDIWKSLSAKPSKPPADFKEQASSVEDIWKSLSDATKPSKPQADSKHAVDNKDSTDRSRTASSDVLAKTDSSDSSDASRVADFELDEDTKVAATGDPHMRNILGERFDLMQEGKHTLIQIPRSGFDGIGGRNLLRVQASAEHASGACADMYFKTVNITGEWAEVQKDGGFHYAVGEPAGEHDQRWQQFGRVKLKVAWGHTMTGIEYLNFLVKNLKGVKLEVGGLLGMDDHSVAATPAKGCKVLYLLGTALENMSSYGMAEM